MNLTLPVWDFFLVLGRTASLLAFFPLLSELQTPKTVRLGIVLWISLVTMPLLAPSGYHPASFPDLIVSVGLEALFGLGFAMVVRMVFSAILLGAQWIDLEMGFGAARQISPLTGMPGSPFAEIVFVISGLMFWSLGFFEQILALWVRMFQLIPPPVRSLSFEGGITLVGLSGQIFVGALQIAAPIVLVMFLVSLTIGFFARAVQGVNLFVESYNIKLLVGMLLLWSTLPLLDRLIVGQLYGIMDGWTVLLRAWK